MKRLQIRLRLMLLLIALLATCFAWIGAVRSRLLSESAVRRMNLEADLRAQQRWRATLQGELQNSASPSHRRSVASQLPRVEARIADLENELAGE